ncbi:hypothetical protein [Luteibacter sp.]|uniref:hypothetical protein n=1 Tax=Luteibacter sp. TaxID=1886636 RepID=UPI003F7D05C6
MADQNHKPQSGDRNLDYVAKQDKLQQERRDKKIKEGEKTMDDACKRDEGGRG